MAAVVGDKWLVSFRGLLFNQRIISTFWYQVTTVTGSPSDSTIQTNLFNSIIIASGLRDDFLACCPPQYLLEAIWIQKIDPLRLVAGKFAQALQGTFGEDASTANLAAVITRRGDVANRHNISALHIPYANLDPGMTNGIVGGPMIALMNALAIELKITFNFSGIATMAPVIRNGPTAAEVSPITATVVQDTVRIMRRRTVRVGE